MLKNCIDFCECITTNIYFKLFVVSILGTILTFVDDIDVFYNKLISICAMFLLILMSFTHLEEFGTILLLTLLTILNVNLVLKNKKDKITK
jgi:integral membrane sensor domain MASE1